MKLSTTTPCAMSNADAAASRWRGIGVGLCVLSVATRAAAPAAAAPASGNRITRLTSDVFGTDLPSVLLLGVRLSGTAVIG